MPQRGVRDCQLYAALGMPASRATTRADSFAPRHARRWNLLRPGRLQASWPRVRPPDVGKLLMRRRLTVLSAPGRHRDICKTVGPKVKSKKEL